jgi:hypothetical protein
MSRLADTDLPLVGLMLFEQKRAGRPVADYGGAAKVIPCSITQASSPTCDHLSTMPQQPNKASSC